MVEAKDPAEEDILSNGRLFIRNLPFTATEEELNAAFRRFGHISQVRLQQTVHLLLHAELARRQKKDWMGILP
jgi:RNA recognition motif-containing protein